MDRPTTSRPIGASLLATLGEHRKLCAELGISTSWVDPDPAFFMDNDALREVKRRFELLAGKHGTGIRKDDWVPKIAKTLRQERRFGTTKRAGKKILRFRRWLQAEEAGRARRIAERDRRQARRAEIAARAKRARQRAMARGDLK